MAPNAIGLYTGPASSSTIVPMDQVSADPRDTDHYVIDPVCGRITVPAGASPPSAGFAVGYCYGFPSTIGAGGYDRRSLGPTPAPVLPVMPPVTGGGGNIIAISGGTVEIGDLLTYESAPDYMIGSGAGPNSLVVRAGDLQRPLVRLTPSSAAAKQWTLTGSVNNGAGSTLLLDGLFVSGGDVLLAGTFEKVVLSACTLDPGEWDGPAARRAIDNHPLIPTHLTISGTVRELVIDRSILGPITLSSGGSLEQITITNSIVQAVAPNDPISITTGETTIDGCTILGKATFRRLHASDSLLCDVVTVTDYQNGCVRFSAWTHGSVLPSQYECVELEPGQDLFASTTFGAPNFARLLSSVNSGIGAGAANGSEMGAFYRDRNPIKERSLLIKYQEYLPIGLTPVLICVT